MQMTMWIEYSVYLKWHLQVISGGITSSWSDKLENFHPDKQSVNILFKLMPGYL